MATFAEDTKWISINKSVAENSEIIPSITAVHALTGCDYVPMMFGVGKLTALKIAKKVKLKKIGDIEATLDEVIKEGKKFVACCYGQNSLNSSENRAMIWKNKTDGAKKSAKPPNLKSLPPTDKALEINIKRAHFVAIMWNNCITGCPPQINACNYGWELDEDGVLKPTKLPVGTAVAPDAVLQKSSCKCASSKCKSNNCGCCGAGIKCSSFCKCVECENQEELDTEVYDDDDSNESDNDDIEL